MTSVIEEIYALRDGAPMRVDHENSNRYRVVLKEDDGRKTAYYFSTPIYNAHTKRVVDIRFQEANRSAYYVEGTNARITVSGAMGGIRLENGDGACHIRLNGPLQKLSDRELRYGGHTLLPTANGIVCVTECRSGSGLSLSLQAEQPFMEVRASNKFFSLMKEHFRPLVTVSCIGVANANGEIVAPLTLRYQKLNDRSYILTFTPGVAAGHSMMLEVNLYEPKLVQDTTVESLSPTGNNAFGGMAFIGSTPQFGEQWLYTKLDFSKLPEMADKWIRRAVLHMPRHNRNRIDISALCLEARFCSFGSNWENKIPPGIAVAASSKNGSYEDVDITAWLSDPRSHRLVRTEGLILRPRIKGEGFTAISTGDSCYAPQILEINYQ